MRAWYYPKVNETMRQAVDREVTAARTNIGIDASTLGKIDIQGPDAANFLTVFTPMPGELAGHIALWFNVERRWHGNG